jgi:hypothetical protein
LLREIAEKAQIVVNDAMGAAVADDDETPPVDDELVLRRGLNLLSLDAPVGETIQHRLFYAIPLRGTDIARRWKDVRRADALDGHDVDEHLDEFEELRVRQQLQLRDPPISLVDFVL